MTDIDKPADAQRPQGNHRGRRRNLLLLALVFVLIGAAVLIWWVLIGQFRVSSDNAYVAGNVVQVSAQVAGTVVAIAADDTDRVEEGQVLVTLDEADARIALQSAEAALAEAVRGVRGLFAGSGQSAALVNQRMADVDRTRQEAARAQSEWQRANDDFLRKQQLFADKFISADALNGARSNLESAAAARAAAQAAIREAQSGVVQAREARTGAQVLVDNTSIESHPRVAAAAAKVKEAYLSLARTQVRAPVGGFVARRKVQVGERVGVSSPLMALVPADSLWVDANLKESELAHVRIDQPVMLVSDLWGSSLIYHGKVLGLSAGTGGAFAVLPPQNASGNWIKIVQRIPVRISLDPAELAEHPLRIGLSMRVEIDTHRRDGDVLASTVRESSRHETRIFEAQAREADERIAAVIAANRRTERP